MKLISWWKLMVGFPPGLDFLFFEIKSGRLCTLDQPYPL